MVRNRWKLKIPLTHSLFFTDSASLLQFWLFYSLLTSGQLVTALLCFSLFLTLFPSSSMSFLWAADIQDKLAPVGVPYELQFPSGEPAPALGSVLARSCSSTGSPWAAVPFREIPTCVVLCDLQGGYGVSAPTQPSPQTAEKYLLHFALSHRLRKLSSAVLSIPLPHPCQALALERLFLELLFPLTALCHHCFPRGAISVAAALSCVLCWVWWNCPEPAMPRVEQLLANSPRGHSCSQNFATDTQYKELLALPKPLQFSDSLCILMTI